MHAINIFIGGLPLFIVLYHFCSIPFDIKKHGSHLLKQLFSFIFSRFLKAIFKKHRVHITKKDIFYPIRVILHKFGSKYAFPSAHVLFFSAYFFKKYDIKEVLFVGLLAYGRVFYGHHSVEDVLFGMIFGVIFNLISDLTTQKFRNTFKKTTKRW